MTYVLLAAKRASRRVYFPMFLCILALALCFAPLLGREEGMPPAAVCDLDLSDTSARIVEYLAHGGFLICGSEAELYESVKSGKYDCGVIIPSGFERALLDGNIDGAVKLVTSPTSFVPDIYKNRAAAAVYAEHAPIIAHSLLPESDITQSEMLEKYRELCARGTVFSFETVRGADSTAASLTWGDDRARAYTLGAASFFIFAIMMYTVCDIKTCDIDTLSRRIGMKRTLFTLVIPDITVRILGILLAVFVSAAASHTLGTDTAVTALCPAMVVYTLLAASWSILAVTVLADAGRVQTLTFFILVCALVICPIYIDVTLFLPWLRHLRWLVAPYLLWLCADYPQFMAAAALSAFPLSITAIYCRFRER